MARWMLGVDMSSHDQLCSGVTFEDIITAVQCNCPEITPEAVKQEAYSCLRMRTEDFPFLLHRNIDAIIAEVKRRKGMTD